MKKGLLIAGEYILLIIVLLGVKIALGKIFTALEDKKAVNLLFYFTAAAGCIYIYRRNMKKQ